MSKSSTLKVTRSQRFITLAILVLVFAVTSSYAQSFVEYTAKYACGTPSAAQVAAGQIAAGTYATTINIHNPHDDIFSTQKSTTFMKKATLSIPEPPAGTALPPPSPFVSDTLPNDFSEEVDCKIIRALLGAIAPPAPAFIEGYVVVIVPPTTSSTASFTNQLDVVGIYTNAKGALVVRPANEHIVAPGTT